MSDYEKNRAVFDLHKLKENSINLLSGLYHFRAERSEKLKQWLSGDPQITLRGGFGSRAVLNRNGFHLKKRSLSWPEIKKVETETVNGLVTHMYVLPEGYSGGIFNLRKGRYALARIPSRERELYTAECLFWKTCCGS